MKKICFDDQISHPVNSLSNLKLDRWPFFSSGQILIRKFFGNEKVLVNFDCILWREIGVGTDVPLQIFEVRHSLRSSFRQRHAVWTTVAIVANHHWLLQCHCLDGSPHENRVGTGHKHGFQRPIHWTSNQHSFDSHCPGIFLNLSLHRDTRQAHWVGRHHWLCEDLRQQLRKLVMGF